MTTTIEKINELKNTEFNMTTVNEDYLKAENELTVLLGACFIDAKVSCTTYGNGVVVSVSGDTVDDMILDIAFGSENKSFSLKHAMSHNFIKFENADELVEIWNIAFEVHTFLYSQYRELKAANEQAIKDAAKKAEADKKAEAKYERLKEKSLKDFEVMQNRPREALTKADEFYYALGWLAKHVGSLTAILPDYLGPAFEKYFGSEAPKTLIDGRAKTSGGYAKQWSWEFKCTIKKLSETAVPACIQSVTTDFSKGIHNTSFLWDLVERYGFQFGKKQDETKIRQHVPAQYLPMFEAGLIA